MTRYDKNRLFEDMEQRAKGLSSLSDGELKKEVSHTHKLLESSLPTCLRKRTESLISSQTTDQVEKEMERLSYEAYWFKLMLDYEKEVAKEAKRRKIA